MLDRSALDGLVDLDAGLISREIFVNEDIHAQELEQVFARAWLFVGHESQIPRPDDFVLSRMGDASVIVTRDGRGTLHVLLNTCRHRGMRVCRYDEGNTSTFTCPFHGWSYATDGRLVGVPHFKDAYREKLDRSQWGLIEVAQLATYKGTIWATWDRKAPVFLDYLGDMRLHLDDVLDHRDGREGGSEVLGGVQKWIVPCNWKFGAENFIGDAYHGFSHKSVDMVGIGPSGKGRRDDERAVGTRLNYLIPEGGHGGVSVLQPDDVPEIPLFASTPIVGEYFREVSERRRERLGTRARLAGRVANVFPNASAHARQPRDIAVWHPRGARKMEVWRWFLVDADAPREVKDALRHYYMRYAGPCGMTEQDDVENWTSASEASAETIARRYPFNYQMAMGIDDHHPGIPGVLAEGITEQNQRGFYRRWLDFMQARSWDDLHRG